MHQPYAQIEGHCHQGLAGITSVKKWAGKSDWKSEYLQFTQ